MEEDETWSARDDAIKFDARDQARARAPTHGTTTFSTFSMVVCGIAVIGKENDPLYIRAWGEYDTLRFHFICHVALDFVEEKGARARSLRHVAAPLRSPSLSLGLLAQSRRSGSRRRSSRRRAAARPASSPRSTTATSGFCIRSRR